MCCSAAPRTLRLPGALPALGILLRQPGRQLGNADLAGHAILPQQLVTVPQQHILHAWRNLKSCTFSQHALSPSVVEHEKHLPSCRLYCDVRF